MILLYSDRDNYTAWIELNDFFEMPNPMLLTPGCSSTQHSVSISTCACFSSVEPGLQSFKKYSDIGVGNVVLTAYVGYSKIEVQQKILPPVRTELGISRAQA